MKKFKFNYGLLLLMLMASFSKNVNIYADIDVKTEKLFNGAYNTLFRTRIGIYARLIFDQLKESILEGKYLNLVLGGIAMCVFLLFTLEFLGYKQEN